MIDSALPGDGSATAAALTSGSDTWHTTGDGGRLPALMLADGPHGLRRQRVGGDALGIGDSVPATCFPTAAALAATWNPDLVREVGRALGRQARALGVDVLLGPGMNIKRSPLGGRNFEYFSEDPHLTGTLAAAMVEGVQSQGVGACVKHFAVNNQETDRMRVSALVDERALREVYLAGFEHVVRTARPWMVMGAYNAVNGVPACENPWLLSDVLRGEWGFDGVVVSDWGAVRNRVAAVRAGCDVEMPPSGTDHLIEDAVRSGELDRAVLDRVRERLTLLAQRCYVGGAAAQQLPEELAEAGARLAHRAAIEAAVLLKNEGALLPLDPERVGSVVVIGELARTPRFQGGGSSRVVPTDLRTPLEELTERLGERVSFSPGYTEEVAGADAVLIFLGPPPDAESEGYDRTTLDLPAEQVRLVERIAAVNPRVAVVLLSGGVVDVAQWQEHARAILHGGLLGQSGGQALADLLLGAAAPSGRLTETIPLRLRDHPSHLTFPGRDGQVAYGESIFVGYRHFDTLDVAVAYPFGHGLTYTEFEYGGLAVERRAENAWEISLTVTNAGPRDGHEVVQLYVGREEPAPTRPRNVLRGYAKVGLASGESRRVTLRLTGRDLAVWDARHRRWSIEPGDYHVRVGASVGDIRLTGTITSPGDRYVPPLSATSTVGEWRNHPVGGPLLGGLLAKARAGRSAPVAPELLRMVDATPLIALRTFGLGLTEQVVESLVAAAAGVRVPSSFLWGTATSAHQVEGNNVASDLWALEVAPQSPLAERSGDACDSYHRWREDLDIVRELGLNAYRFGIEWARVEPAPGHVSRAALAHYRRMIEGCLERGITPIPTLHHFTSPAWFRHAGGWTTGVGAFAGYVRAVRPILDGVQWVCTINEPNMLAMVAGRLGGGADRDLVAGALPPPDQRLADALIAAHHAARDALAGVGGLRSGWTVANQTFQALPGAEELARQWAWTREDQFLEAAKGDDFIGVQAYTRVVIGPDGPVPPDPDARRTQTGWEFYPEALEAAVRHTAAVVKAPILVTENGIATADDSERREYLHRALAGLGRAIADGVDVRGYLHWSLLDNYEWGSWHARFGLVEVDRDTFTRTVKPSARWYGDLARTGLLPHASSLQSL